jgi:hypothetical protein
MSGNRALRRIFGPKRHEVTADWRKLHDEEFHNLYSSPEIIRPIKSRRMRWAGHVARTTSIRYTRTGFVGKPEKERPYGRSGRRRKDIIKMNLREVGVRELDSSGSGYGQLRAPVNTIINLCVS